MDAWMLGPRIGKASLRRMQFKSAEDGNVTMQIWLGKQMLGQRDKSEIDHGVTDTLAALMAQIDGRTPRIPGHVPGAA